MFKVKSHIKPNYYETIMNDAFQLVKSDIAAIRKQGTLLDSIGKKDLAQVEYNKINSFFYVIYYFVLIKIYLEEQSKLGTVLDCEALNDRFDIPCIKATIACIGINISKIIALFDFNQSFCILLDGIEYVGIEINSPILESQDE